MPFDLSTAKVIDDGMQALNEPPIAVKPAFDINTAKPVEVVNDVIYDPEQDKTIEAPAGITAKKLKYLDAVQNNGENPNSYLAGIKVSEDPSNNLWDRAIRNMGSIPNLPGPTALISDKAKQVGARALESLAVSTKNIIPTIDIALAENTPESVAGSIKKPSDMIKAIPSALIAEYNVLYRSIFGDKAMEDAAVQAKQTLKDNEARQEYIARKIPDERWARNIFTGTQVAANIFQGAGGVILTKNTAPLVAYFTALTGSDTYNRQRSAGVEPSEALLRSAENMNITAFTEKLGLDYFSKALSGAAGRIVNGVLQGTSNAAQEVAQEFGDIISNYNIDPITASEAVGRMAISAAWGFTPGAVTGVIIPPQAKEIKAEIKKDIGKELGIGEKEMDVLDAALEESRSEIQVTIDEASKDLTDPDFDAPQSADEVAKVITAVNNNADPNIIKEELGKGASLEDAIKVAKREAADADIVAGVEKQAQELQAKEDALIKPELIDTDPQVIKARIKKLDSDLTALDNRIDAQLALVTERASAGKTTKAVENKLESLLNKREVLATELASLETASKKNVASTPEDKGISEQSVVAAESLDKPVEIKGQEIRDNAKKLVLTKIKNLIKGIRKGKSLGREEARAVQRALVNHINNFIKNSGALSSADKAKFITPIAATQTFEQFKKNLPLFESMLARAERKASIFNIRASIKDLLKSTKPKKRSGKLLGEYNPELQKQLDSLRALGRLNQKNLRAAFDAELKALSDLAVSNEEVVIDENLDIKKERIGFRLRLIQALQNESNISPESLSDTFNDLKEMIDTGKDLALQRMTERKERREKITDKLIENVQERYPDTGSILQSALEWFDSSRITRPIGQKIEDAAETISEHLREISKYSVYTWLQKVDFLRGRGKPDAALDKFLNVIPETEIKTDFISKVNKNFGESIKQIFGLKYSAIDSHLLRAGLDKVTLPPYVDANEKPVTKRRNLTYSRAELIDLYMLFQRGKARAGLLSKNGNAFTPEFEANVTAALTEQDKAAAELMQELYDEQIYPQINPVFRQHNFIDLPKDSDGKYTPIVRKDVPVQEFDDSGFFGAGHFYEGVSPGFLKEATKNEKALRPMNAYVKFQRHLHEAGNYIAYADKAREFNATILSPKARAALEAQVGSREAMNLINNVRLALRSITGQDYVQTTDHVMKRFWTGAGGAVSATTIMLKPFSALMQISAHPLYAMGVNKLHYAKGVAYAARYPTKAWNILKESPTIRDRFSDWENLFEGIVPERRGTPLVDWLRNRPAWRRYMYTPIKVADIGVVVNGAYARYYALTKSGTPHVEALAEVAVHTELTQQPRSRAGTPDIFKGFFSQAAKFLSGPVAGFNVGVNAIRDFRLGRITAKQMSERITLSIISISIIPTIIQAAFSGGDESDEAEEVAKVATANLIGSIPIFGGMMLYAADKLLLDSKLDAYEPRTIDPFKIAVDITNGLNNFDKIEDDAFLHYDKDAYNTAKSLGLAFKLPLNTLYSEWIGLMEIMRNDPDGFIRVLGRTQSQIKGSKEAAKISRDANKKYRPTVTRKRKESVGFGSSDSEGFSSNKGKGFGSSDDGF